MRNRLSYYSILLLVGLALVSAVVLIANPFDGAARASASAATTTATSTSAFGLPPVQVGGSPGTAGSHHDHGGFFYDGPGGNATSTTAITVPSQNE